MYWAPTFQSLANPTPVPTNQSNSFQAPTNGWRCSLHRSFQVPAADRDLVDEAVRIFVEVEHQSHQHLRGQAGVGDQKPARRDVVVLERHIEEAVDVQRRRRFGRRRLVRRPAASAGMAESATAAMALVRNSNPECRFNMARPPSVDRFTPAPAIPGVRARGPATTAAKRVPPLLQNTHTAARFAAAANACVVSVLSRPGRGDR